MSLVDTNSWERLPDETVKAFQAFCVYRDMGTSRSWDKSYRQLMQQPQNSPKTAPTHWREWAEKYRWAERVTAYDAHQERESRRLHETQSRVAYEAKIEQFRQQAEQLASSALMGAVKALQKGLERLNSLDAETIDVKTLPSYLRASASLALAAVDAKAMSLGIEELIKDLNERTN